MAQRSVPADIQLSQLPLLSPENSSSTNSTSNLSSTRPPQQVPTMADDQATPTERDKRENRDFVLGLFLLAIVVILWTSSNFITQDLFVGGFDKPFLVTYLNTSSFAIYLIPFIYRRWRHRKSSAYAYQSLTTEPPQEEEVAQTTTAHNTSTLPPLTTKETASLALLFCFLWFIANWTVNAALRYTSVGSTTVLASTSGLFTMAMGALLGFERFSLSRLGAVLTSFFGVVLVTLADSSTMAPANQPPTPTQQHVFPRMILPPPSHPIVGDVLALLSAAFYALYLSLLKVRIKDESRVDMQLFFGFVGLFNIIGCWPLGLVLHLTGIEEFVWPSGWKAWSGVIVNMGVTFSSDYLYVIAMLKTTPLVVTLGLTLTIPLAIVGDMVLQSRFASALGLFGALLVVGAFGVIGWDDSRNDSDTRAVEVS